MSKKLIVFALRAEAQATLNALHAEPVEWKGEIPCLYAFEQGWIAISGIGLHAAQMTAGHYGRQADEIWNLGLAGALRGNFPIGKTWVIDTVGKYIPSGTLDSHSQEFVEKTVPSLSLEKESSHCCGALVSSDFPIHDHSHRTLLSAQWDLVDMEGYGVAYAAHHLGKKCRMWKIVSDFASPGGRELIQKNLAKLSESLAETVYETIHESRPHP